MSDNELIETAYKVIHKVLGYKFNGYRAHFDDLAQEVILEVVEAVKAEYEPTKGKLEDFIFSVARRRISKAVRPLRQQHKHELVDTTDLAQDMYQDFDAEAYEALIDKLERVLTAQERLALRLKLDGKTNTEIYRVLYPEKYIRKIGKGMTPIWQSIAKKLHRMKEKKDDY